MLRVTSNGIRIILSISIWILAALWLFSSVYDPPQGNPFPYEALLAFIGGFIPLLELNNSTKKAAKSDPYEYRHTPSKHARELAYTTVHTDYDEGNLVRHWSTATTIGFTVSWLILAAMGSTGGASIFAIDGVTISRMLGDISGPLSWLMFGTVLGLFQVRVLRDLFNDAGWWVPASSVGYTLGFMVVTKGFDSFFGAPPPLSSTWNIRWLVVGIIAGLSQWVFLRNKVDNASWWIPINGVSLAIGIILLVFVGRAVDITMNSVLSTIAGGAFGGIVGGVVAGSISGLALARLLRKRI